MHTAGEVAAGFRLVAFPDLKHKVSAGTGHMNHVSAFLVPILDEEQGCMAGALEVITYTPAPHEDIDVGSGHRYVGQRR